MSAGSSSGMAADPSQLIDAAEEITAARLIHDNIEDAINEEDARFLLGLTSRWMSWQTAGLRRMVWMPPMVRSCSTASGHCGRILTDDAGPRTVRDFLATHVGGVFSLMTPCGFVPLTAAQAEGLMSGQSAAAHPGVPGITMSLSADDLAQSDGQQRQLRKRRVAPLTEYPEMKQCGPEKGGMQ